MPRNIEVEARIASASALLPLAQALADGPPQAIAQGDSLFVCVPGRLKLRDFGAYLDLLAPSSRGIASAR